MEDSPPYTMPSELFAMSDASRPDGQDGGLWPATSNASDQSDDFNLDNFDTELNFGGDMDIDLEKLCREILGPDADSSSHSEAEPFGETPKEELGACASISRSSSESEGFSTSDVDVPVILHSTDAIAEIQGSIVEDVTRTRVVRISGMPGKTAIPIVLGRSGLVRDPAKAKICILRRPALETGVSVPVQSFEELIAGASAGVLDDCSVTTDVSSPTSSEGRDEDYCEEGEFQRLVLTEEEKKIMAQENITLPERYPLTREEERNLRRIRRKIRNKRSAQNSRKRKQVYVDDLEKRVKLCSEEKAMLQKRVSKLESENASLLSQLRNMQSAMSGLAGKAAPTSTAFLILVMSVAMLLAPNMRLTSNVDVEPMRDGQDGVRDPRLSVSSTSVAAAKRTLLADMRSAEPINGDTSRLDDFFKQLQAFRSQFSWIGDAPETAPNGDIPSKRQRFDATVDEDKHLSSKDSLAVGAASFGVNDRNSGILPVLEADGVGEPNVVYLRTNQTAEKVTALKF